MFDKFKDNPRMKDMAIKAIAIVIVIAVALLAFDVMTQSKDGRKQILDEDGGTEAALCTILKDIKGVGAVDVMLQQDDEEKISGVIVTAEGAKDPIVRNNLVNAVKAVFNIPASSVMVFEKESEGSNDE
ncbi:MAG: hypothetical protein RSA73_00410 [Anaerovoracaceae bacterium]